MKEEEEKIKCCNLPVSETAPLTVSSSNNTAVERCLTGHKVILKHYHSPGKLHDQSIKSFKSSRQSIINGLVQRQWKTVNPLWNAHHHSFAGQLFGNVTENSCNTEAINRWSCRCQMASGNSKTDAFIQWKRRRSLLSSRRC